MKFTRILSISMTGIIVSMASQAFAEGDVAKGKKLAKKCKSCHTMNEGGKNGLGPNLFGIIGAPAGAVEGFKYSKAMLSSDIMWDDATFNDFILKPKAVVAGTKMSFKGIKKATQREDLLAYFQTLRNEDDIQGNAEEGKRVVDKHCVVCHSFEEGGKVVFGPNLFGIVGKPAASIEGFKYSDALKNSGLVWTDTNLVGFMSNPEQFVKGTTARFPGLKSAQEKADILIYMKSLK